MSTGPLTSEVRGKSEDGRPTWPGPSVRRIYGVNAITVFVMSGIVAKSMGIIRVGPDDRTLHAWVFETVFLPLASPVNASLLFALAWVAAWWLVLEVMHRRGLIIKV